MSNRESGRAEVRGLGLDEFLGHSTRGGGSGAFLKNWKKDGEIEVWLHRTAPVYPLWAHGWHEVVEVEDRDSGEKVMKVFNRRFVCHERELVLKKQRFREADGTREYPPEVCPACLLIEHVYQAIQNNKMDWTDTVFSFQGDDDQFNIEVLAGGLCGFFQKDDLSKQQQAELRKAGVRRDEAFKQNMLARCQYVLSVVDAGDPSEGVQTALEATSLGDKLKLAIKHEVKRRKERGNPAKHPYPFALSYDENKQFAERYDVVALETEPSDEILRLISGDAPDLTELVTPSNCMSFRSQVEAHLVEGSPLRGALDEIFAPAEKAGLMDAPASPPKGQRDRERQARTPEVSTEPKGRAAPAPAKGKQEPAPEQDTIQCDHCDADMTGDSLQCDACGATYQDGTGKLDGRPCLNPDCKGGEDGPVVPLDGDGPRYICPTCGTLHESFEDPDPERRKEGLTAWRVVPPEPKVEPAGRRRRGGVAPAQEGGKDASAPEEQTPAPAARRTRGGGAPGPKA